MSALCALSCSVCQVAPVTSSTASSANHFALDNAILFSKEISAIALASSSSQAISQVAIILAILLQSSLAINKIYYIN